MKKTKIKVCHVADHLTGKADGIFTQLVIQFSNQDPKFFENHLIIPKEIENLASLEEISSHLEILPNLTSKFPIVAFWKLIHYVKKNKIDIIHVHFLKPYILVGLANIIMRKPAIYNFHGLGFNNVFNSKFETFIYKSLNKLIRIAKSYRLIIAPSESSKQFLIEEAKLNAPIETYQLGMDEKMFNHDIDPKLKILLETARNENFIIGVIARVDVAKRVDRAVEICRKLVEEHTNVSMFVLGDGDKTDEVKEFIAKMGLKKKIHILGYVKNSRNYIKYFDLLLLTSDWEGFPIVVWEAMASGIPVVATDVGGIKEIIEKENCGQTFPLNDLSKAKSIILELIKNEEKRTRLGSNGYLAFHNKYQYSYFIKKIEKWYEDLVS